MSEHGGHTLSRVEVKDADVLIGTGGGDVETRRIDLHLRRTEDSQHLRSPWKRLHGNAGTNLDERPVLALRAFIQLLLFPVTDVEDPAGGRGDVHLHHLYQSINRSVRDSCELLQAHSTRVKILRYIALWDSSEHITVNMRTQCDETAVPSLTSRWQSHTGWKPVTHNGATE